MNKLKKTVDDLHDGNLKNVSVDVTKIGDVADNESVKNCKIQDTKDKGKLI